MQQNKIIQQRLWVNKQFALKDGILIYTEKGIWSGYQVEIRFEELISGKKIQRKTDYLLGGLAFLLAGLAINNWLNNGLTLAASAGITMAIFLYYLAYRNSQAILILDTVYPFELKFYYDKKQKEAAKKFIQELLEQRKLFLVEKYWDCVDDFQQKNKNLNWLKNCNILNIDEFNYLKTAMNDTSTKEVFPIGFRA